MICFIERNTFAPERIVLFPEGNLHTSHLSPTIVTSMEFDNNQGICKCYVFQCHCSKKLIRMASNRGSAYGITVSKRLCLYAPSGQRAAIMLRRFVRQCADEGNR